ncbi:MAG: serine hydrolase [Clostridiales bacterium]|nr:serine hydrolase [Clostridiales bacterium]
MKSSSNNYNVYSSRRRNAEKRRNFVIACLAVCMCCVIADTVFITLLVSNKGGSSSETTAPSTSASIVVVETDEEGNPITSASESGITVDPNTSETTAAPEQKKQTVDAETRAANLATLQKNVSDYLTKQNGRYSMYYINLKNGETIGVNEGTPMVAASSIKLAYNTFLYEKVADGKLTLDEKMAYNATKYPQGDFEGGTGTIQNSADGTEYTLKEVSHLSITASDNCATNMLLRRLGGIDEINNSFMKPISAVVDYRTQVSYTNYRGESSTGKNRTSSIDLAKYAEHLYNDLKASPEAYQPLIDDLCSTEYNWGVPGGVPGNLKVAHKVGFNDSYGAYNDLGIVFGTEDYVLAVMTESGDGSAAKGIIGEVSKMVYEYIESNYA